MAWRYEYNEPRIEDFDTYAEFKEEHDSWEYARSSHEDEMMERYYESKYEM